MKRHSKAYLAVGLICLSITLYLLQNSIYHNFNETGYLILQDMAFLPLYVLFTTLLLESLIKSREKKDKLDQINIVVSAFFSEMGTETIRMMNIYMENLDGAAKWVKVDAASKPSDFKNCANELMQYDFLADSRRGDLAGLGEYLYQKKDNILVMFENPNLLENDRFTSMLWAIYHVMDELKSREDFASLPDSDLNHLSADMKRAYQLLAAEWIFYMGHLKEKYPYLFSLAVRKNPFIEKQSVVIG